MGGCVPGADLAPLPPTQLQFPYTHHVECGVYLQRREQADGQQQQGQQQAAAAAAGGGEQPGEDGGRAAKRKAEAEPAA